MPAFRALLACLLTLAANGAALAQDDPAAAYARLHAATLAGNAEAAMPLLAAPTQAELSAKPAAERDSLFRAMAEAMPKTYTVSDKSVTGQTATLTATGISEFQGRTAEAYLSASFRKEGDSWKITTWNWSNQKPAAPPPKPVEQAASAGPAPLPAQESKIIRRGPGTDPNAPAALSPAVAAKPAADPAAALAKRPSRAHLDARECLKLPTYSAIRACAEKYR